jgi:nitric oxide reductase subunit C
MLSKSQAKLFFLGGTLMFSLVFLWLTVDTIRQTPKRSNADNLSETVIAGRMIWDEENCMGCHTILGEGAYYAPELTKVVTRRGEGWIRSFLKNPEAFYPGRRKMVQYDFTEEEITELIAFFSWIEGIDTNGFPPDPPYKEAARRATVQ